MKQSKRIKEETKPDCFSSIIPEEEEEEDGNDLGKVAR